MKQYFVNDRKWAFFLPVANEMLTYLWLLLLSNIISDRVTYHNYQVRRVYPENQEQIEVLRELEKNPNGVSWF
jgi:hypothetical protein